VLAARQLVPGTDAHHLLVQLLLDLWVLGQLVQTPGDGVGGLGREESRSHEPLQPFNGGTPNVEQYGVAIIVTP